jgi:glyoxylase-like metal-dependent hydrolase (beta-lactamase superfamily II)
MKMHLLSGGRLRMRRGVYYPDAAKQETMDVPVSCTLLKHPQALVLFDTGCNPAVARDAEARWGSLARFMTPIFAEEESLMGQLPLAGVAPADIDVVICSHLHPDHCGCNVFFPRATVMAHVREVAAARAENAGAQGYLAAEWEIENRLEQVDGERDLLGDRRITLLPMPGHTPGSMAAHVVLDRDGTFLLAADAAAVSAHLDQQYTPKNTWNADAAMASLLEIARLQAAGATVLFGHDAEQWRGLRTGAEFYAQSIGLEAADRPVQAGYAVSVVVAAARDIWMYR